MFQNIVIEDRIKWNYNMVDDDKKKKVTNTFAAEKQPTLSVHLH